MQEEIEFTPKAMQQGEEYLPVFETLSQQEQLLHLQYVVEKALFLYGMPEATSVLLQYEDNAVYRIVSRTGAECVLRISAADGHNAAAQYSETQWLLALRRETDLLVPSPILNVDGAPVTTVDMREVVESRHCVLFSWIPGEPPPSEISQQVIARIGAFTAHLHNHAERFAPPADFVRPQWDWQHICGPSSIIGGENNHVALTSGQRAMLTDVSTRMQHELQLLGTQPDQWGLIHADLHRDNILIKDEQIGVIDFDDCGWGHYLLDITSVLDSFRRRVVHNPQDYPAVREAYLAGYDQIRHLPDQLDTQLATCKALRDMVTLNFILGSNNATVQEWGSVRLKQIMTHLQEYLEGSLQCI